MVGQPALPTTLSPTPLLMLQFGLMLHMNSTTAQYEGEWRRVEKMVWWFKLLPHTPTTTPNDSCRWLTLERRPPSIQPEPNYNDDQAASEGDSSGIPRSILIGLWCKLVNEYFNEALTYAQEPSTTTISLLGISSIMATSRPALLLCDDESG